MDQNKLCFDNWGDSLGDMVCDPLVALCQDLNQEMAKWKEHSVTPALPQEISVVQVTSSNLLDSRAPCIVYLTELF